MEEVTSRSRSNSRDPLTPEPQDPAPQKKKKKKKSPAIGCNIINKGLNKVINSSCDAASSHS